MSIHIFDFCDKIVVIKPKKLVENKVISLLDRFSNLQTRRLGNSKFKMINADKFGTTIVGSNA